jgi:hypothetical protein
MIMASPMRDIAHCFPGIVQRGLEVMTAHLGDDDPRLPQLNKYANAIVDFIEVTAKQGEANSISEAFELAGLNEFDTEIHELAGKWITRALMGFYFKGLREALRRDAEPIGLDTLRKLDLTETKGSQDVK